MYVVMVLAIINKHIMLATRSVKICTHQILGLIVESVIILDDKASTKNSHITKAYLSVYSYK